MPVHGQLTYHPARDEWLCGCGARAESIKAWMLGHAEAMEIPGGLIGHCSCPRCITCGWVLDQRDRCDNLDCPLLGTHILIPDIRFQSSMD